MSEQNTVWTFRPEPQLKETLTKYAQEHGLVKENGSILFSQTIHGYIEELTKETPIKNSTQVKPSVASDRPKHSCGTYFTILQYKDGSGYLICSKCHVSEPLPKVAAST